MHGKPPESRPITVLVVDDSPDITAMISRLLQSEPDMCVVGVLHDADGLARAIAEHKPRVVLLDLSMPGPPVLDALRAADPACRAAGTRVLAFSGYDDGATESQAIQAGACGLLSKGEEPEAIVGAVRKAAGTRPG